MNFTPALLWQVVNSLRSQPFVEAYKGARSLLAELVVLLSTQQIKKYALCVLFVLRPRMTSAIRRRRRPGNTLFVERLEKSQVRKGVHGPIVFRGRLQFLRHIPANRPIFPLIDILLQGIVIKLFGAMFCFSAREHLLPIAWGKLMHIGLRDAVEPAQLLTGIQPAELEHTIAQQTLKNLILRDTVLTAYLTRQPLGRLCGPLRATAEYLPIEI